MGDGNIRQILPACSLSNPVASYENEVRWYKMLLGRTIRVLFHLLFVRNVIKAGEYLTFTTFALSFMETLKKTILYFASTISSLISDPSTRPRPPRQQCPSRPPRRRSSLRNGLSSPFLRDRQTQLVGQLQM